MDAVLLLANSAEASPAGLVYALGLGFTTLPTPTTPISLIALIDCPWGQTNRQHAVDIELLDGDGQPVLVASEEASAPLAMTTTFETGRPAGVRPGSPIRATIVINLGAGLHLEVGQTYAFHLSIDGSKTASWSAAFSVRS